MSLGTVDQAAPRPAAPSLSQLAHVPGSKGLPIVGHTAWFLRDAVGMVGELSRRHGPNFVMRMFGNPVVVLGSPVAVREALLDKEKSFSSYWGWEHAIGELFRDGLMLRDFADHRAHRRIMQTAFRADPLRRYLDRMNPLIEEGIGAWSEQLHFYPSIKKLMLDVAADVFLGIPLDERAAALNRAFVDANQASIAVVKKEVPGLSYKRGMDGRRLLESFFFEQLPIKRESDGDDMFSEFCRATDEDGARYSDREVVDHMIFLLMAAHDTTTSALSSIVSYLARMPELQERLRAEVVGKSSDQMTYEERDGLDLCDWTLKEALRMHPPVPFIGRRAVRDAVVGGVDIPAFTPISICSLVTHQLEELWTSPRSFDPDRFSPDRAEDKQHSHAYFPFGGGAHMCIGLHFAGLQVKAFLVQFLKKYRVSVPQDYEPVMIPIPIPKPKDGLPVHLERID
ncbi:MAG: cytochrome P450 [Acidobacteriota bacterium]